MFQKCVCPLFPVPDHRLGYAVAKRKDVSSKGHRYHRSINGIQLRQGVPKIIGMMEAQYFDEFLPAVD